jgi:hypothetical protein
LLLDAYQWIPMLCFSVLPESFPDKFWIFFRKMLRNDLSPSVSGS